MLPRAQLPAVSPDGAAMREWLAERLEELAARLRPRSTGPAPAGIYQVSWYGHGTREGGVRRLTLTKNGAPVAGARLDPASDDGRDLGGTVVIPFDPARDTLALIGEGQGVGHQLDVPTIAFGGEA